jgi:Holliday junction resolvasome RuvABC endonuclease subunit
MMVKEWTPSEWRTGCDMKGNASKDEVAEWVAVTAIQDGGDHRAMFDNQNACDAYAIAYATRAALETVPSIALSPAQATLLGDDNPTPVPSKGAVT